MARFYFITITINGLFTVEIALFLWLAQNSDCNQVLSICQSICLSVSLCFVIVFMIAFLLLFFKICASSLISFVFLLLIWCDVLQNGMSCSPRILGVSPERKKKHSHWDCKSSNADDLPRKCIIPSSGWL